MATEYYTLSDDKQPVPCSRDEWLRWVESGAKRGIRTRIGTEVVETQFTGWLRNYHDALFRSTVYGLRMAGTHREYGTYAGAMAGHKALCAQVRQVLATAEAD